MQDLREAVTSIDQAQKPLLSPFTWNHLSLPPLARATLTASVSSKPEKKSNKLATIEEARRKGKQNKQVLKDKLSRSINYKQKPQEHGNIASEPSKMIDRPRRYNKPATHIALSKTIQTREKEKRVSPRYEGAISTSEPCKRIKFLDSKHNMEQYLKMSLNKAGWKNGNNLQKQDVELLWANIDRPTDHFEIGRGQFYNHISGTHYLTTKNGLHQELAQRHYPFFPRSFLIPENYDSFLQQNTNIAVLAMIRRIGGDILRFIDQQKLNFDWQDQTCLGKVLQSSILQTGSEETNLLVKLCMYLEVIRVQKGYIGQFQSSQGYQKVIIKPKPTLFQTLINHAVNYLAPGPAPYPQFDFSQIDYRLLVLLLHYHRLFEHCLPTYSHAPLWIIKPIASSRGAGISITRSIPEFCLGEDNERVHYKNRKKYENKVIQQYIPNPYLLDKGQFAGRKFDIRQWVLLVSHATGVNAYRYHTGYCRFASQKFTLSKLDRQIHLTNYSLFSQDQSSLGSVMMLQELFSACKEDLRSKYVQQSITIISEVISNCRRLRPQQGCFELLGFDFLLDSHSKLHLLEINLNPACATHRYQPLQVQSNKMSETMLELVTKRKSSSNWQLVAGSQEIADSQEDLTPISNIKVKPFYEYCLGEEESLIALIRLRNKTILAMNSIIYRYYGKIFIQQLLGSSLAQKQAKKVPTPSKEKLIEPDQNVAVTNEVILEGGIRFVEQRSTQNANTQKE